MKQKIRMCGLTDDHRDHDDYDHCWQANEYRHNQYK